VTASRSKAARAAVWSVVENGGMALVSFLSLIVYSRFLSPSDFGVFSVVLALVELLNVLVTMLFHDALVQRPEITRDQFDTAFSSTMALSVLLAIGCVAFGPLFAHLVRNASAGRVLGATALALPCAAASATIVPAQRRALEFRALALRSVVGRLAGALLGMALVVAGAHFWGLVAQYVLVSFVGSAVLLAFARERPRFRFHPAAFRELIRFGLFSVGGLFLNLAVGRIFIVLAGIALGTQALGYLNLGFRAVDVLFALAAGAVSQAALPTLARLQSDPERLRKAYSTALELVSLVLYPCFVGMAAASDEIVRVFFGAQWAASSPYVAILAVLTLVRVLKNLARPLLTAVGRPQDTLVGTGVELAVLLAAFGVIGVRSLPMAVGVWVARELLAVPATAYVLKSATGLGYREQVRGSLTALVGSAALWLSIVLLRHAMPPSASALERLAAFVPASAASFLAAVWIVNPRSVANARSFVVAAAARGQARQVAAGP
jgi:O-antigen/teichoic acid export membrane protein